MNQIIEHHGVLGMKWGIRKYQTTSGKLTPEGKNHLTKTKTKSAKAFAKDGKKIIKINKKEQQEQAYKEHITKLNSTIDSEVSKFSKKYGSKKVQSALTTWFGTSDYKREIRLKSTPLGKKDYTDSKLQIQIQNSAKGFIKEAMDYELRNKNSESDIVKETLRREDSGVYNKPIKHHGVLGMKWGVRRYRDKKGRRIKPSPSEDAKAVAKIKKKPMASRTNEELKTMQKRGNLEADARRLYPNLYQKGQRATKVVLASVLAGGTAYKVYKSPMGKAAKDAFLRKYGATLYMKGILGR